MNNIKKIIKFLSIPMVLTIVAYILFFNITSLPMSFTFTLKYISYVFFIIGMLVGLRFNKSKVFFLCLILGISQLFLTSEFSNTSDIISFLLPLNIFVFSMFKERGIITIWGKCKFGLIMAQFVFVWWLLIPRNSDSGSFIYFEPIHFDFINIIPIPQLSILLFLLVFLALSTKLYFNPTLMDSSLIGVVIMTFTGLLLKDHLLGLNLFYAMSGLILVIGVLEASYFMAYRDELTGISGRRALKESMMKLGGKYAIAMVDIDLFKKFNDTYGHDTGDEVLKMVASSLGQIAGGGKAFRFGGEEFTILFANKTREEVIPTLEELRKDIEKQKHTYRKKRKTAGKDKYVSKQLGVTISIGVAEKNENYKTADEVLKAADKALYKAKKNGRNCVCK